MASNTLRVRRAEVGHKGISQRALAKKAGIPFNRYWHIEQGYTEPTEAEREALALALGCELAIAFPLGDENGASAA